MKERPITFTEAMIHAIEGGRKWQTRRVLRKQPLDVLPCQGDMAGRAWVGLMGRDPNHGAMFQCQYGLPGDRLWVRETWATVNTLDHLPPSRIWQYDRPPAIYYAAWTGAARNSENRGRWRSPRFMPRWASRYTLELSGVRVERVRDISHADALAEGVADRDQGGNIINGSYAITNFMNLWDHINAKRGHAWETNPWVWVLEFKLVTNAKEVAA